MLVEKNKIQDFNEDHLQAHKQKFNFAISAVPGTEEVLQKIIDFQIAIPSWALGAGGTRFGRFSIGGEPSNLEEKIEDVGLLHALNRSSGAISLHIPWDIPENASSIKAMAAQHGLRFDAVNSNTFQDQQGQDTATSLDPCNMLIKLCDSRLLITISKLSGMVLR